MSFSDLYEPLPTERSVRLLRLRSGVGEDQLACSLEVVEDFQSGPTYHALSYCWGDANDVVEMQCNQQSMYVTRNLYAALQRLKTRKESLPIWADAVCIDQKNVAERNQQVSIMDRIFSSASIVYVWLGHSDVDTSRAITIIQRIIRHMHARPANAEEDDADLSDFIAPNVRGDIDSWVARWAASGQGFSVVLATAKLDATDYDVQDWNAFYNFYQAEWFFRAWVVQEVQEGKDVKLLSGDFELPWDWVGIAATKVRAQIMSDDVFDWTKSLFTSSLEAFDNARTMWRRVFWTRRQAPFLSLLDVCRTFRATDPRDKVFAMLHHRINRDDDDEVETISYPRSLSEPTTKDRTSTHLSIEANYRMTILQVYREVAVQSIRLYRNLEVLSYSWDTAPYDASWPSWIPRWDMSCHQRVPSIQPFLYGTDRQHEVKYDVYHSSNSLRVYGFQIGTICEKSFILKYPGVENGPILIQKDGIKDKLQTMISMVTRDCWRPSRLSETNTCRTRDKGYMPTQFSDFCAFTLPLMEAQRHDCYISLWYGWCDMCDSDLASFGGGAVTSPVKMYHCFNEDFDMCSSCFHKGLRPPDSSWILQPISPVYMWLPYTRDVVEVLKKNARDGQNDRFFYQAVEGCNRAAFFQTSEGDTGSASENIEPGDIVVVLLGCRVPVVLRKSGSAYRLISDAYVEGFMDGKAIDMWQNGKLEQTSFEIR